MDRHRRRLFSRFCAAIQEHIHGDHWRVELLEACNGQISSSLTELCERERRQQLRRAAKMAAEHHHHHHHHQNNNTTAASTASTSNSLDDATGVRPLLAHQNAEAADDRLLRLESVKQLYIGSVLPHMQNYALQASSCLFSLSDAIEDIKAELITKSFSQPSSSSSSSSASTSMQHQTVDEVLRFSSSSAGASNSRSMAYESTGTLETKSAIHQIWSLVATHNAKLCLDFVINLLERVSVTIASEEIAYGAASPIVSLPSLTRRTDPFPSTAEMIMKAQTTLQTLFRRPTQYVSWIRNVLKFVIMVYALSRNGRFAIQVLRMRAASGVSDSSTFRVAMRLMWMMCKSFVMLGILPWFVIDVAFSEKFLSRLQQDVQPILSELFPNAFPLPDPSQKNESPKATSNPPPVDATLQQGSWVDGVLDKIALAYPFRSARRREAGLLDRIKSDIRKEIEILRFHKRCFNEIETHIKKLNEDNIFLGLDLSTSLEDHNRRSILFDHSLSTSPDARASPIPHDEDEDHMLHTNDEQAGDELRFLLSELGGSHCCRLSNSLDALMRSLNEHERRTRENPSDRTYRRPPPSTMQQTYFSSTPLSAPLDNEEEDDIEDQEEEEESDDRPPTAHV